MAPTKDVKRPAAKAGYVWTIFGDKDGLLEIHDKGKLVVSLKNALVQFPVTPAAIAECCKDYEYVVTDVDGKEYPFRGVNAAVLSKYDHALETVRGLGRPTRNKKGEVTRTGLPAASLLQRFLTFTGFGGRQRSGVVMPAETLESFNADNFGSADEALAALKAEVRRLNGLQNA